MSEQFKQTQLLHWSTKLLEPQLLCMTMVVPRCAWSDCGNHCAVLSTQKEGQTSELSLECFSFVLNFRVEIFDRDVDAGRQGEVSSVIARCNRVESGPCLSQEFIGGEVFSSIEESEDEMLEETDNYAVRFCICASHFGLAFPDCSFGPVLGVFFTTLTWRRVALHDALVLRVVCLPFHSAVVRFVLCAVSNRARHGHHPIDTRNVCCVWCVKAAKVMRSYRSSLSMWHVEESVGLLSVYTHLVVSFAAARLRSVFVSPSVGGGDLGPKPPPRSSGART